jgi:hypothetical protein
MKSVMRMLLLSLVVASGLTLTEATSPGTAPTAHAATAPGYITLLVGRGMYGKVTGGRLDPRSSPSTRSLPRSSRWGCGRPATSSSPERWRRPG